MADIPEFLLVDDHVDNRFLLAKTLVRKFPSALILECQESAPALVAARRPSVSAAVVHRGADMDGLTLVARLRETRPTLPILFVSGAEVRAKAFEAGASAYLNYDAWLRVGTVVEDMLRTGASNVPFALGAQPA